MHYMYKFHIVDRQQKPDFLKDDNDEFGVIATNGDQVKDRQVSRSIEHECGSDVCNYCILIIQEVEQEENKSELNSPSIFFCACLPLFTSHHFNLLPICLCNKPGSHCSSPFAVLFF